MKRFGIPNQSRQPPNAGGLLALHSMLVFGVAALLISRQFGVRCPYCLRLLTGRCLPSRVLQSSECCHCHSKIIDESQVA
jgi:hypothetical protein